MNTYMLYIIKEYVYICICKIGCKYRFVTMIGIYVYIILICDVLFYGVVYK